MDKAKYIIYAALLLISSNINAQQVQDTIFICDNGGFEIGNTTTYSFFHHIVSQGTHIVPCENNSTTPYSGVGNDNNQAHATLVDNNPLYDQALQSAGVSLPRTNTGEFAIKLNNDSNIDPDVDVTAMKKTFKVKSSKIYFSYAIVGAYQNLESDRAPYFIVNLKNSTGAVVNQYCLQIDGGNTDEFSNIGDYLYKPWACHEFSTMGLEEQMATIEFIISDDSKLTLNGYATVYIDDICEKCANDQNPENPSCEECIYEHIDVPGGAFDLDEAWVCVNADNTINPNAVVDYYADNDEGIPSEVVLLAEAGGTGFECLYRSDGYFHIKVCTNGEPGGGNVYRKAMPQSKEQEAKQTGSLQIYPNPANNELNIVSADTSLKAVRMLSLDGKVVLERQPGANNNKNIKLDVRSLSSGIYILTVETTDGAVTSHKIVRK